MFLARSVFGCTITEICERLPAWEIPYWVAYYRRSPWGDEWAQTGVVSSIIANAHRDTKRQKKPFSPEDFMPGGRRKRKKKQMSPEQIQAEFNRFLAAASSPHSSVRVNK